MLEDRLQNKQAGLRVGRNREESCASVPRPGLAYNIFQGRRGEQFAELSGPWSRKGPRYSPAQSLSSQKTPSLWLPGAAILGSGVHQNNSITRVMLPDSIHFSDRHGVCLVCAEGMGHGRMQHAHVRPPVQRCAQSKEEGVTLSL